MAAIRPWLVAVACAASLFAMQPAAASVSYQLAEPALAARINGDPLHAFTVDTLWRQARAGDATVSRTATLEALVGARLLAASARKTHGTTLETGHAVAFAPQVALDDRLAATLREVYRSDIEQAMRLLPGGTLDGLVTDQPAPSAATLDAIFGKPGQLRLELTLTAAQQEQAAAVTVLRYRLPNGETGAITLQDVYRRQNVQGRVALYERQTGFLQQQAKLALGVLYAAHWASQQYGKAAVLDLRQALEEQETVLAVQRLHGIGVDTDAGSALLDKLAAQVGNAGVLAYYRRHKEEFTRIEKVKARHIRLDDEAAAQAAFTSLQGGADFGALARRLSRAVDAPEGGDLGWLRPTERSDWLSNLAYSQMEGQASRPIRSPVGPHDAASWEIVLVEKVVMGYQPVDSETVRYAASRAIARDTALAQLAALRVRLLREARIDVNRRLLDQPLKTLGRPT